jgi:hypothetical protein
VVAEPRREVADLDRAARGVAQPRDEDRRIAVVVLLGAHFARELDRVDAVLAPVAIEQRGKQRVRIEARQARPHQAPARVEKAAPGAVSDHRQV